MIETLGVSIIVVNYNNERFLAAAIDSALGQSHPFCEVIAVDDRSTDNSQAVIASYGDRIRAVLRKTNGGQVEALNSAWPLACYPIFIFLDSDDILLEHAVTTIIANWTPAAVKIQAPLVTIDETGRKHGRFYPRYSPRLDTARIRAELLRTGGTPNSPASGNAYSRSLLEAVARDGGFELDDSREYWMDTILACNAPFFGEVISLSKPFACYRTHDRNSFATNAADSIHFNRMLNYFAREIDYFTGRCRKWGIPFDPVVARSRSLWTLECQFITDKLVLNNSGEESSQHAVFSVLHRALRAYMIAPLPISDRFIRAGWFISVAISPKCIARRLIRLRFVPIARPAWIDRAVTIIVNMNRIAARRVRSRGLPKI
jgi:glycosyltransferase involved in cell wall biosynthesis